MSNSNENSCPQATNNDPDDHPKTSCPTTASLTSESATFSAKDNADNDPHKQTGGGAELDADLMVKTVASKTKVRKSVSSTPLRTRSGLTRQPAKRLRPVVKPVKKTTAQKEHHVSWIAPSTSTAVSNKCEPGVSSTPMPTVQNVSEVMSALSIRDSAIENCTLNGSGSNLFNPNSSNVDTTDHQQQPAVTKFHYQNNINFQGNLPSAVSQTGFRSVNSSIINNFTPTTPRIQMATSVNHPRGEPKNSNNLFPGYPQNYSQPIVNNNNNHSSLNTNDPAQVAQFSQTTSVLTAPPAQSARTINAPSSQITSTLSAPFSQSAQTSSQITSALTVPFYQPAPTLSAPFLQSARTSTTPFSQTASTLTVPPTRTAPNLSTPFNQTANSINTVPSQPIPYLASTPFANSHFNSYHAPFYSNNQTISQHDSQCQVPVFMNRTTVPSFSAQHANDGLSANLTLSTSQVAARQVVSKDLPAFSGNPAEWPIFITNYVQSTERCGFTDEENLIRLQKSLKGQALEAVRGKLMMPATVNLAVETLRMLFGRPEVIHHTMQKKLKDQPPVRKERLETLIHLALAVQNYNATMQAMGLADYLNDPTLLNDLVEKLPCDMKLDWGRYRFNFNRVDINVFDGWLYSLATCASHVTSFTPNINDDLKKSSKERLNLHDVTDSSNKATYTSNYTVSCCKCLQSHRLAECSEFLLLTNNERWKFIRNTNLCLRCFKKHPLRRCYSKKQCGVDGCTRPHNPLLHSSSQNQRENTQNGAQAPNETVTSSILFHAKENKALFRYVPVTLYGKCHSLNTFALIDEGSSCTLIEKEIASELGLDGPVEELCLQWTGDITQVDEKSKVISLKISPREQTDNKMLIHGIRTIANLDLPTQTLTEENIAQCEHLRNLPILPYTSAKARMLIGIDNAKLCVPLEIRESASDGIIAARCRIGWGVYGRHRAGDPDMQRLLHICPCGMYDRVDEQLRNYFSLDSIGVKLNTDPLRSKEDERAIKIMESTVKYCSTERVWETGLLWKFDNILLPDSFSMACRRLYCLEAKMKKDPVLKAFLIQTILEYEQKGYIRKLQQNEISYGGKSWFIPIFTVKNKNKNKTRIVWDAAAAVGNISLNSVLLKGPDLLKSIVGVLLRFRERPFAIAGDIREMFHQIRIAKNDQCAQQFLWRAGDSSRNIDVYAMTVMTFGASCSPSLANCIKNRNAERFTATHPKAVQAILDNTFVDDWLQSMDSEEETIEMAKNVRTIHEDGGFEMRNWLSNSKGVIDALQCPRIEVNKCFEDPENKFEKVLGMWWLPPNDEITFVGKFEPDELNEDKLVTKRSVLRMIMTIFDPLGLLGHFVIYAKIILQEIWRSGIGWDEPLLEPERKKWFNWIRLLPNITNLRIPRCLTHSSNVQLHTFVDASLDAYAAVAYLRVECEGRVKCSLVASKTRVAPLKPISVPRLELIAAVTGLRLSNFIVQEMSVEIHRKCFWTDSKDVLYWIRSDARKYQQFTAVRIGEILEGSHANQWRWVPSTQNVADEGTKWSNEPDFQFDTRWFSGPTFLRCNESEWPNSEFTDISDKDPQVIYHIESQRSIFPLSTIVPDPDRFSKWEKFRFVQQLALKYIEKIVGLNRLNAELKNFIHQKTIETTEMFIFKACQEDIYFHEILCLKSNKSIPEKSALYKLSPYRDALGVLRMQGRINVSNVPMDVKRPILLPPRHRITQLLIDFYHRKFHHHHNEIIVNEIRQRFWITGLRAAVRTVAKRCQLCKIKKALPGTPKMADLPIERISTFTRPFHFTGIDYFGPIDIIVGRRKEKRWGVLFTCLTVRAVHIEIAPSLSTDSFLLVFKQFTSRRGVPRRIISDNATNFRGACRVLAEEIEKISTDTLERQHPEIEWVFIPPSSPHMGGSWERMVRSTKSILMDILPTNGLREEVLRASLADVENILNSRPLTYVPLESPESEALTPNHLLLGSSSGIRERANPDDSGLALSKNFRISSGLADSFWKRWVREVLPCLTRRTKWHADSISPLAVNDVVIIVDERTKRNTWKKGIVIDVHRGKDNVVRSAVVKTENSISTRPAVKLAKLDVIK